MIKSVEIDLVQGSDEWIANRLTKKNASELSAAMNMHPNIKRTQLLRVRATGKELEYSDFVRNIIFPNGHRVEAIIREMIERDTGEDFIPKCFEYGEYACSLDGQNILGDTNLEIKQFNKDIYESVRNGIMPAHHAPQVQQGLWITGAEKCIFAVANPDATDYVMVYVEPDNDFFDDIPRLWNQFELDANNFTEFDSVEFISGSEPDSLLPVVTFTGGSIGVNSNIKQWFGEKQNEFNSLPSVIDNETAGSYKAIGDNMDSARVLVDELLKRIEGNAKPVTDMITELKAISKYLSKGANYCKNTLADYRKQIRQEACDKAIEEFNDYLNEANAALGLVNIKMDVPDFMGACSRTKNHESLSNAVGAELAKAKISVDKIFDDFNIKLGWWQDQSAGLIDLFNDLSLIITKPIEDFQLVVKTRIDEYKTKQEALRAEMNKAEEAEATIKAAKEAEAQRPDQIAQESEAERLAHNDDIEQQLIESIGKPVIVEAKKSAVIAHQDEIRAFFDHYDTPEDKRQMIRPYLVEFIKFKATQALKQAA
jgi:hypothetical protein